MTAEFVCEARTLLDRPPSTRPGLWARAAILLARQALEDALDDFWRARSPDLLHASMRAQLLCLGALMHSQHDAADVDQLWACSPTPATLMPATPQSTQEIHVWLDRLRPLRASGPQGRRTFVRT